jgi:hypothetical protein
MLYQFSFITQSCLVKYPRMQLLDPSNNLYAFDLTDIYTSWQVPLPLYSCHRSIRGKTGLSFSLESASIKGSLPLTVTYTPYNDDPFTYSLALDFSQQILDQKKESY